MAGNKSRLQSDFDVGRLLGSGSFGAVLQCSNRLDKKAYAIKVEDFGGGYAIREVQNMVKVPNHENLVQYYTCWEDSFGAAELKEIQQKFAIRTQLPFTSGKTLCIQMELCGGDLRNWLAKNLTVNEEKAMSIFNQLNNGLDHLHANQILHRDLKPDNIFINDASTPRVKIGDLGISTAHTASTRAATHTRGCGTPLYLAPEQGSSQYGKPADMYALGLIFYELLNPKMQPKANGGSYDALVKGFSELKYQRKIPCALTSRWPKSTDLILKLTSVDPRERPNCKTIRDKKLAVEDKKGVHDGKVCGDCGKNKPSTVKK